MSIKKFLFFTLRILLIFCALLPVTAVATEGKTDVRQKDHVISIQYIYINQASTSLTISKSGMATVYGYVQKTPSGKSIKLTSTLQRYSNRSWLNVKSWSKSSTSLSASILETYKVSSGNYRVETYYYVAGKDGSDSGVVYSKMVTY